MKRRRLAILAFLLALLLLAGAIIPVLAAGQQGEKQTLEEKYAILQEGIEEVERTKKNPGLETLSWLSEMENGFSFDAMYKAFASFSLGAGPLDASLR